MKSWIKGALWGFVSFVTIFVVLSLSSTGRVSLEPFYSKTGPSEFNYYVVGLFVIIGALIGLIVGKIKNKKGVKKK